MSTGLLIKLLWLYLKGPNRLIYKLHLNRLSRGRPGMRNAIFLYITSFARSRNCIYNYMPELLYSEEINFILGDHDQLRNGLEMAHFDKVAKMQKQWLNRA